MGGRILGRATLVGQRSIRDLGGRRIRVDLERFFVGWIDEVAVVSADLERVLQLEELVVDEVERWAPLLEECAPSFEASESAEPEEKQRAPSLEAELDLELAKERVTGVEWVFDWEQWRHPCRLSGLRGHDSASSPSVTTLVPVEERDGKKMKMEMLGATSDAESLGKRL